MIEQARNKLWAEMEADGNPYIHVVGHFLLKHLDSHPGSADKIMAEGKTIIKSLTHMETEAKKRKVGTCAVLTDEEGFAIVLEYFGIDAAVTGPQDALAAPTAPAATSTSFDINLEDLL